MVLRWCKGFGRRAYTPARVIAGALATLTCNNHSAVGPQSGSRILWNQPVPNSIFTRPAVAAGAIYLLSASPTKHEAVALNGVDGSVKWRTSIPAPAGLGGDHIVTSGSVVVLPDTYLYGLDLVTGQIKWTFQPTVGRKPGVFGITGNNGVVYAGSASGNAYAIDAVTGQQLWVATIVPRDPISVDTPVFANGMVFYPVTDFESPHTPGALAALNATTGAVLWVHWLPHLDGNPATQTATINTAAAGGLVFVDSNDGPVYALDQTTGDIKWSVPRSAGLCCGSGDRRRIAVSGNILVVGSTSGIATAVDATTGSKLWDASANYGTIWDVSADDKYAYLLHSGGQLAAVELASGRVAWIFVDYTNFMQTAPASSGSFLYVGSSTNALALRRD